MACSILYEAAQAMLTPTQDFSRLTAGGLRVVQRRGLNRAAVAVAQKCAIVLDCRWTDGTTSHSGKEDLRTTGGEHCNAFHRSGQGKLICD